MKQFDHYAKYAYGVRKTIQRICKLHKIDVCHYTQLHGLGAFAPKSHPMVVRLSSYPDLWAPYGFDTDFAERIFQDISIRRADLVTAPSTYVGNYVSKKFKKQVSIIPSPYLPSFKKNEGVTGDPTVYGLYFGSLAEWKGVGDLVEALRLLLPNFPTFKFYFVGRELGEIKKETPKNFIYGRLDSFSEQIVILPSQPFEKLVDLIDGALFCCFPTLADNFPNVVLDAMSRSKCIISTRGRGVDEQLVDGFSGVLVEPSNPSMLAQAISDVIQMNPGAREIIGKRAYLGLQNFAPEVCANKLTKVYSKLICSANKLG